MPVRIARLNRAQQIAEGTRLADQQVAPLVEGPTITEGLDLDDEGIAEGSSDMVYVYLTEGDEDVRHEHARLHTTQWELDDPAVPIPPLAPGCRCRIELRSRNRRAERRTGVQRAEKNPPEPGAQALRKFWKEAKHSSRSATPGEPVMPRDTLGQQKGKLVEDGDIEEEALIGDDGGTVSVAEAKGIAKAGGTERAARNVLSLVAQLQGMGISLSQARRFANLAKSRSGSLLENLADVITEQRPGFIGARTVGATRTRAKRAAERIIKALGL